MSEPPRGAVTKLVEELFAAINARDAQRLADISEPGFEWRDPPDLAGGGLHNGAEAVIAFFVELDKDLDGLEFGYEEIVDSGDAILVHTTASGRGRESGIPADTEFFGVYRLRDGRIASQIAFFDRASAEQELRDED